MLGIPWEVTEHALRLVLGSKPTKQCLHCFDDERHRAIGEEVAKLLAAGFIKEVYHSNWPANPILLFTPKFGRRVTGTQKLLGLYHQGISCGQIRNS